MKRKVSRNCLPVRTEMLQMKKGVPACTLKKRRAERLIQELKLHQTELELQNDDLTILRQFAETARDKYLDLYDFAPVGYYTIDINGVVLDANLFAGHQLGINKDHLINKRFSSFVAEGYRDSFSLFLSHVLVSGERCTGEVMLNAVKRAPFFARLDGVKIKSPAGPPQCYVAAIDIKRPKETRRGPVTRQRSAGEDRQRKNTRPAVRQAGDRAVQTA